MDGSSSVLSFSTRVDLSGAKAGFGQLQGAISSSMAESASSVEGFSARAKAAMAAYNQAATGTVAVQKSLGAAFDQAIASGASFAEAQEQAVAATLHLATATDQLTSSETREVTASRGQLSARMAASAEMRVLEGNTMGSTRAAAAFLTTTLGLGPALQSAFAVFGAIALLEIIVEIGKAFYNAFDLGGERARKLQGDISDLTRSVAESTNELTIQTEKMQEEDARIEKVPFNGIKLALDEATEAAYKLEKQLQSTDKEEQKVLEEQAGSFPQRMIGSKSNTKDEQTMLEQHERWLQQAITTQDTLNESKSYGAVLQTKLNDLQRTADSASVSPVTANAARNQIASVQELIRAQQAEQKQIEATIASQDEEKKHQGIVDAHQGGIDADKANRELLANLESTLATAKTLHDVSAADEEAYWSQYLATFKAGTSEYISVNEKYVAARKSAGEAIIAMIRADGEEMRREYETNLEISRSLEETQAKIDEENKHVAASMEAIARSKDEGALQSAKMQSELDLEQIATAEAEGGLTKYQASILKTQARVAALNAELGDLGKQLDAINSNDSLTDLEKIQQSQPILNQMQANRGQQQLVTAQGTTASAQALSQPYLTAFNDINQGFLNVQQKMILGTQSISRDFANMGAQLVAQSAAWAEKMLAKEAEKYIKELAMKEASAAAKRAVDQQSNVFDKVMQMLGLSTHVSTNVAKVASDTTAAAATTTVNAAAAATSVATTTAAGTAQIGVHAAVAGAGAMAAMASVPYIGPFIAPAIAAGIVVAVMELAKFETGGIVPNTGVALVHQGEAVLPNQLTGFLMHAASNYSTSSSAAQTNNFYGSSDRQFRSQMTRNATHTLKTVQRGLRAAGRA